jgi:hypothetical protein
MAHWGHAMSILENPFGWPATFTPPRLDSVVATRCGAGRGTEE